MQIKGKIVFITGGCGGFGIAFARSFLEKGAKVCLSDIKESKAIVELEKAFGKCNILFTICDVTKDEHFEKAFKKCEETLGSVDILINNAGLFDQVNLQLTLDVNLHGLIRGCEFALKRMGKHKGGKGGHVVNIGSVAGIFPFGLGPFYSASKGAIVQYSRSVGDELHYSYSGVVVQCLCPSFANTPMAAKVFDPTSHVHYNEFTEQTWMKLKDALPLIEPTDVAKSLLKLIEEEKNGAVMVLEYNKEPYYAEMLNFT